MEIQPQWLQHDIDLKPFNTMGLPARARYFAEADSVALLQEMLSWACSGEVAVFPLGGGSNIILDGDFDGLVILVRIPGAEQLQDLPDGKVLVRAGAGENWHQFVRWAIARNCFGLENLSLIPGCVGAAPIQNIGAYGMEICDLFHSLEAIDIHTGELKVMGLSECEFGYRDSVFKRKYRDQLIVTSVTFVLSRTFEPCLGYGHLQKQVLEAAGSGEITPLLVSDTVCRIREAKLPDPEQVGNAGSFFKNPIVSEDCYQKLLKQEPELVAYPAGSGLWKLAAGWLIDRCGFRGLVRDSGAGVYEHQALVLVNRGRAAGKDILALAEEIQAVIKERFKVILEIEPRVY